MAAIWTVIGESGKDLDATERSVEAIGAAESSVAFRSLAADKWTWTVPLEDATAAGAILPQLGQKVTLNRDGSRFFEGWVTGRRVVANGRAPSARITVSGPWWWLSQLALSSEEDDQAGNTDDRPQFVFDTGSPRTFLIALADRAIALGAPISVGSIASVFSVPRLTLRNMSFAEAFAEIMRWVADGILFFDYSAEGDPAVTMQRRDAASTVTLTPADTTTPLVNIGPRLDLEVEEVIVKSAKRETVDNKRAVVWEEDSAGAVASGLPRRQINVTTGPEVDTWLPQDFTDSVDVQTKAFTISSAINSEIFADLEDTLRATNAGDFNIGPGEIEVTPGTTLFVRGPDPTVTDRDGDPIPSSFDYYLVKGEPRSWWAQAGIEHKEARIVAVIYQSEEFDAADGAPDPPLWFEALGGQEFTYLNGTDSEKWWWTTVNFPAVLVKEDWSTTTTLIRPEDYAFVNPPDGLAANLLATQGWLPWEGIVQFVYSGSIPAGHHVGAALNIAGFRPETANMRALISGHSVELDTGLATLELGAPDRLAYRDLVNRFRVSGNDNIVYLVESVSGDPSENPAPDPELQIPQGPDNSLTYAADFLTYSGDYLTFTESP